MTVSLTTWQEKIAGSENILVVYGEKGDLAAAAAATSIYLWLKKESKNVTLAAPVSPTVEFCHLVGINKVKTQLPQEKLVITLPYRDSKIEKVLSEVNPDTQELNLIVKPQRGQAPPPVDSLRFSYQIADYDLVVLVDVRSPKELARLAGAKQQPWTDPERIITYATFAYPAPVKAKLTEVLGRGKGFCAYFAQFFLGAALDLGVDIASNLLMGLAAETANFQAADDPDLFELAAGLMHQGATRYRPDTAAAANFDPKRHLPSGRGRQPRAVTSVNSPIPRPSIAPGDNDLVAPDNYPETSTLTA